LRSPWGQTRSIFECSHVCGQLTDRNNAGFPLPLTHRQSVVQATKSARLSAIQWYLGVGFAILFFGGFLVKSWWEERVFVRDTRRLLAYYKHVLPGSMLDGDIQNARYVVYKYRNKKNKLWRGLEKKYDVPVLMEDEWENWSENDGDDEEHEDLDANEDESTDEKEQEL